MAQRKAQKTQRRSAVETAFQSIASLWLEHWQDGKSPRHVEYVKRRIETDILPCLRCASYFGDEKRRNCVAMTRGLLGSAVARSGERALETVGQNLPLQHCPRLLEAQPGRAKSVPATC